jgi:cytochrome P450
MAGVTAALPPTPPRILPPAKPLGRLGFMRTFVRNPLEVIPAAAYEEDFVAPGGAMGPRFWVTSPALVKAVLLDQRDKFQKITQVRLLAPLLGKGILTTEGAEWKWQRQASAPMFKPAGLASFVPTFVRVTEAMLARWRATPGATIAIDAEMSRATFEVISATLLPCADQEAFERSIAVFQKAGGWGQLFAALNAPKWLPRPGYFAGIRAIASLRSTVRGMIGVRRALIERGDPEPDDLMHRLMAARDPESGQSMNDERLVDNLLTFYLAGHDTTAKALTWTLYLLARSPGWAASLEEEIERVTGGAPVAGEHIERLELVRQVVKESMRLYPPVPLMSRQAVADVRIGEHDIRAGSSVLMPIYTIHRHKGRWENPDEFDPTRFAPAREEGMPRYQYMPFGAGPRVCIGREFAMIEATAMLATLVRHARFETLPGHEPHPIGRVTLTPGGGMPLRVTARRVV